MSERYVLEIEGRRHKWSFEILADAPDIEAWRADGLKVERLVDELPFDGDVGDAGRNLLSSEEGQAMLERGEVRIQNKRELN